VGEEEMILDAVFQSFHNAVIIGETAERAADRLRCREVRGWSTTSF